MTTAQPAEPTLEELEAQVAQARTFEGWDFTFLGARAVSDPLPWDYIELARGALKDGMRVLDLGTGGGERFAEILDGKRVEAVATETYPPNRSVARRTLRRLGASVVGASSEHTPFPFCDDTFDLVLSRHEAILPSEVYRVLRPGGAFITQQCDAGDWPEVRRHFPEATHFGNHFTRYQSELEGAGAVIERAERAAQTLAYPSLRELIFIVAASAWMLPDLDVRRDYGRWLELARACTRQDGLHVTEVRYVLVARKSTG